jgi:stage II sporulation protein R
MKKICISLLIVAIIILSGIGLSIKKDVTHTEYLRIHVRAQSNDATDQAVKYKVKDAVIEYLTPFIAECDTKEKAQSLLTSRLTAIEAVADRVLKENGFSYTSKASVKKENFPTRVYGDLELESGIYDALILELGSGKGDNWWCVVYPPLCFTGQGTSYVYKSKISEIIGSFFNKEKDK